MVGIFLSFRTKGSNHQGNRNIFVSAFSLTFSLETPFTKRPLLFVSQFGLDGWDGVRSTPSHPSKPVGPTTRKTLALF